MTLEEQEAGQQMETEATPQAAEGTEQQAATPDLTAKLERAQEKATSLASELEREREKATDYMNRWQRAQADLANYKRRVEQEREQDRKYGPYPLFLELLKIQDNFQRAFETLP